MATRTIPIENGRINWRLVAIIIFWTDFEFQAIKDIQVSIAPKSLGHTIGRCHDRQRLGSYGLHEVLVSSGCGEQ